jgi:hypothetical protein
MHRSKSIVTVLPATEIFIAPNAVLVSARTDAVLIDVGRANANIYGFGMTSYFHVGWL